jgi:hypothetical protein
VSSGLRTIVFPQGVAASSNIPATSDCQVLILESAESHATSIFRTWMRVVAKVPVGHDHPRRWRTRFLEPFADLHKTVHIDGLPDTQSGETGGPTFHSPFALIFG